MKKLLIILLSLSFSAFAQSDLKFDNTLINCIDKWVVLPQTPDSLNAYGFVYMDPSAGLTFNLEGQYKYDNSKYQFIKVRQKKIRILPNETLVAIIPKSLLPIFSLPVKPEWLSFFKENVKPEDLAYRYGITYLKWKDNKKAFNYLNGTAKNLDIRTNKEITKLYKDEIVRLCNYNMMKKAEETYRNAIVECEEEEEKAEMAYAITYQYYKEKQLEKFNYWLKEIDRWVLSDNNIQKKVEIMQRQMATL
jgi:hypothetical protein